MGYDGDAISFVIPARDEAVSLRTLLRDLTRRHPDSEVIVVNDGSVDDTSEVCHELGAKEVRHHYSMGNGAAIKAGARAARGDVIVFLDADGQHNPADVGRLIAKLAEGYDMVVGARVSSSHASLFRRFANRFYNTLASWMTRQTVLDLTSGFRAVRAAKFREYLHLLPNGFSYPTTITMAFFRTGYSVAYVSIRAGKRQGSSHIQPLRDGLKFLLIILKVGTLYSPLKLFLPVSGLFLATGCGHYIYTYVVSGRFTNMSALMLTTAVLVFLIGMVSEQITQLLYRPIDTAVRYNEHEALAAPERRAVVVDMAVSTDSSRLTGTRR